MNELNLTIYVRFSLQRKCGVVVVGQEEHKNLVSNGFINFHHKKDNEIFLALASRQSDSGFCCDVSSLFLKEKPTEI